MRQSEQKILGIKTPVGVVRVGGVHGVGKSTLIKKALEISGINAPVIKGSEIMADYLKISPESLPFIGKQDRGKAREYMYEQFSSFTYGIRDGHFCVYSDQGYEFPANNKEKMSVTAAVVIVASPLQILFRRRRVVRRRPLSIFSIIKQQKYEIRAANSYAQKNGIKFYKVRNNDFDKAVKVLSEIFIAHLK